MAFSLSPSANPTAGDAPFPASSPDVAAWYRVAKPGAHLVYFTGAFLDKANPAVKAASRLIERGLVLPVQQRLGPGQDGKSRFEYRIVRRRNAEPAVMSRAGIEDRAPKSRTDDEVEQLMAVLRLLANRGDVCPTNAVLAELACLKDAESARYRLSMLEIGGRIAVVTPPQGARIVTIVSSGRTTSRGAGLACGAPQTRDSRC